MVLCVFIFRSRGAAAFSPFFASQRGKAQRDLLSCFLRFGLIDCELICVSETKPDVEQLGRKCAIPFVIADGEGIVIIGEFLIPFSHVCVIFFIPCLALPAPFSRDSLLVEFSALPVLEYQGLWHNFLRNVPGEKNVV